MTVSITGGCRCGHNRYSINTDAATQMICHCEGCYKRSGPYMGGLFFLTKAITFSGERHRYTDVGGTGCSLEILACKECGSIFGVVPEAVPLVTVITANSLDDQKQFNPLFHNWAGSKPTWVTINDNLPQFEKSVDWEQLGGRPDFGTESMRC